MKPDRSNNEYQPKKYSLQNTECETIVIYNNTDEPATIYTCSKSLVHELTKKGYPQVSKDTHSTTFKCDKKFISFRTIEKTEVEPKKKLSAEHLAKLQKGKRKTAEFV